MPYFIIINKWDYTEGKVEGKRRLGSLIMLVPSALIGLRGEHSPGWVVCKRPLRTNSSKDDLVNKADASRRQDVGCIKRSLIFTVASHQPSEVQWNHINYENQNCH